MNDLIALGLRNPKACVLLMGVELVVSLMDVRNMRKRIEDVSLMAVDATAPLLGVQNTLE